MQQDQAELDIQLYFKVEEFMDAREALDEVTAKETEESMFEELSKSIDDHKEGGAKINGHCDGYTGGRILHTACGLGENRLIKLLVDKGASANIDNDYDENALETAMRHPYILEETIRYLFTKAINKRLIVQEKIIEIMMLTVKYHNKDLLVELLETYPSLYRRKDKGGRCILHHVQSVEDIDFLSDIFSRNGYGFIKEDEQGIDTSLLYDREGKSPITSLNITRDLEKETLLRNPSFSNQDTIDAYTNIINKLIELGIDIEISDIEDAASDPTPFKFEALVRLYGLEILTEGNKLSDRLEEDTASILPENRDCINRLRAEHKHNTLMESLDQESPVINQPAKLKRY